MNKNQKVLVTILALAVIGLIGYFAYKQYSISKGNNNQNQQSQSTTVKSVNDQTSGWQTYTNTHHGFSFKYSPSFGTASTLKDGSIAIGNNGNVNIIVYLPKVSYNLTTFQPETYQDLLKKYDSPGYTKTSVMVGNIQATVISSPQIGDNIYVPLYRNEVMLIVGNLQQPQFKQVLSTFNFVNQQDASIAPTKVNQCVKTRIAEITTRLIDSSTGLEISGSGSNIIYTDGVSGVSYDTIPQVEKSEVGDSINLCLASIPTGCPPGDDRGRMYKATNLRTGESWSLPDSEHGCGGA